MITNSCWGSKNQTFLTVSKENDDVAKLCASTLDALPS
jgi:hypothetical protein